MKCLLIRAAKTFVQAFIATVAAAIAGMGTTGMDFNKAVILSTCVSGIAAGISAVMNLPAVKKLCKDYGEGTNKEA